jgi:23S rRNA pseudouridine1911/1915/1917 synthase
LRGNASERFMNPADPAGKSLEVTVPKEAARMRLDLFLAGALTKFSRSRLQQLIRDGFVRLNGRAVRVRQTIQAGDRVELKEPPLEKTGNLAEDIPLDILFEDEDLLVINKPPGLVVHPGAGHREHTLVNALLHHCQGLSRIGGEERPGIVHRLDKDTSGCLVVATNDEAHRSLSAQFAGRIVEKVYLAIVSGRLKKREGAIEAAIARHPVHRQRMTAVTLRGRTARTEYSVEREGNRASLVECRIHSGRTHQIRVHFHHLGHPVMGDKVYGAKGVKEFPRQMLHAWKLAFKHPRTGEWECFEAPLPDDFKAALRLSGL